MRSPAEPTMVRGQGKRERAQQGINDHLAVEFARYRGLICAICLRITRDPCASEDLVQDTFVKALDCSSQYRGGSLPAWLAAIAKNECYTFLRGRSTVRSMRLDPEQADRLASSFLRKTEINDFVSDLPSRQRSCIRMFFIEGLTYAEIAERLPCSVGQVKSWLQNGLRRMRATAQIGTR